MQNCLNENSLKIVINKPIDEVYNFTINPNNTPKWIDSINKETINTKEIKLGTKYKNNSGEYTVTALIPDKLFELSNASYKVRYTYKTIGKNKCELSYFETGGNYTPLTQKVLQRLKQVIENNKNS